MNANRSATVNPVTLRRSQRPGPWLAALLLALLSGAWAASAEPLHPSGKRDLYERVLTHPGAMVAATPGGPGRDPIKALSRLYVYARATADGQEWLRVGTGTRDQSVLGWLPTRQTTPWRQQLTLAFTNRAAGREPMLFLRSGDDLRAILDSPAPGPAAAALRGGVAQGRPDPRVLAVEPANFIDFTRHFYLLPILDFAEYRAATGDKVRALKVASVTLSNPADDRGPAAQAASAPPTPGAPAETGQPLEPPHGAASAPPTPGAPALPAAPAAPALPTHYRAAVVFVIDSTVSMGPYIAQTKAAVGRFYQQVRTAGLLDRVAFGLVAFRAASGDPAKAEGLEFIARTYANPSEIKDGRDFLKRVRSLDEARVATDRFDEDPYAGIQAALDTPDWRQRFAERHIILITDAGALDGSQRDPATGQRVQSRTGLDAERLRSLAGEAGTSIAVLHLLTPEARRQGNTETAAAQYRTLSRNAVNQETAYFPIAEGSVTAFTAAIDTYAGRLIENLARPTPAAPGQPPGGPTPPGADQAAQIRAVVDSLGHAARLAYLGQVEGTRAPEVFEAWISDRDFADPSRYAVDVRVLLTKDQLSDLQQVLKGIVEAAEADLNAEQGTRSFFDRLASVAARFSVDPQAGSRDQSTRLADLGLLGEYLQGLPYKSDVLALTQDTWTRWGAMRQYEFIDQLNKKIRRYGLYYADQDKWVDLAQSGGRDQSELVYPIPLSDLP